MEKKTIKSILIIVVVVMALSIVFTACGALRLEYASLSQAMMKQGYKEAKKAPEDLEFLKGAEDSFPRLERVILFHDSTLEENKDNLAYVVYCKTSDAADAIEHAIRSNDSLPLFYVYRDGRVIVYANNGGMQDIKGYN